MGTGGTRGGRRWSKGFCRQHLGRLEACATLLRFYLDGSFRGMLVFGAGVGGGGKRGFTRGGSDELGFSVAEDKVHVVDGDPDPRARAPAFLLLGREYLRSVTVFRLEEVHGLLSIRFNQQELPPVLSPHPLWSRLTSP